MVGGNLPEADDWTMSLLTNPEAIAVDQHSSESRQILATDTTVIWSSKAESGNRRYVAVFNISPATQKVHHEWKQLDLESAGYKVRDLWEHKDLGPARSLEVTLPSHTCVFYSLLPE